MPEHPPVDRSGTHGPRLAWDRAIGLATGSLLLLMAACAPATKPPAAMARVAEGPPPPAEVYLRVMRDGTEAELYGELKFGSAEAFERLIDANPTVRTVHLNSPGGLVLEGLRLREIIFRHGLDTYTSEVCSSACTYAFLGGREQYLRRGARLGFHAVSEGKKTAADLKTFDDWRVQDAIAWGVDPAFAAKAYLTPNETIWYPTAQELLDAKVVTKMAEGQFTVSGFGANPSTERLAQELRKDRLLGSIAQARPAAFDRLVGVMLTGVTTEQRDGEMQRLIWEAYSQAAGELAARSSDESMLALGRVLQEQTAVLRDSKAASCQSLLPTGSGSPNPYLRLLPRELRGRELTALGKVLASGGTGRPRVIQYQRAQELYVQLHQKIAQKHGETLAVLINSSAPGGDPRQICKLVDLMYQEILLLPPEDGAALLRYRLVSYLAPGDA